MKIKFPEGFPEDTPLSTFMSEPDKYTITHTAVHGELLLEIIELSSEHHDFLKINVSKVLDAIECIETCQEDIILLKKALELINYIDAHVEYIKLFHKPGSLIISCMMMCLYKISDPVKNRNLDIFMDTQWHTFDLLVNLLEAPSFDLITRSQQGSIEPQNAPPHMVFQLYMLPKIIDEIRTQMSSAIKQMIDTEQMIKGSNNITFHHPAYQSDNELCKEIVRFQLQIEKAIENNAENKARKSKGELKNLLKAKKLNVSFPDLVFFCKTPNDYYSIAQLRDTIKLTQSFNDLSTPRARAGFLQCCAKLGEYMTHRKLSNKFRAHYPEVN